METYHWDILATFHRDVNWTYEKAKNRKYDGYQTALASTVYKTCGKKAGSGMSVNEPLAEKSHKPVVKKLKKNKSVCEI